MLVYNGFSLDPKLDEVPKFWFNRIIRNSGRSAIENHGYAPL